MLVVDPHLHFFPPRTLSIQSGFSNKAGIGRGMELSLMQFSSSASVILMLSIAMDNVLSLYPCSKMGSLPYTLEQFVLWQTCCFFLGDPSGLVALELAPLAYNFP